MCSLLGWLRHAWTAMQLPVDRLSDFDELLYAEENGEVFEPDDLYSVHLRWMSPDVPPPGRTVPPTVPGGGPSNQ